MFDQCPEAVTRRIAMLIHPNCDLIDAGAPLDVFSFANLGLHLTSDRKTPAYQVSLIADKAGPVQTFSGMRIIADHAIGNGVVGRTSGGDWRMPTSLVNKVFGEIAPIPEATF